MNPQEFEVDVYGSSTAFHQQQNHHHHHHGQMVVLRSGDGGMEDACAYDNGDPSLLLPTLVDSSNFAEHISGAASYYAETSSADQNNAWLAPLHTSSQSDLTNSTDVYRSYLPDQMHIRLETPIDHNNAFYYTPVLEPVEFPCGETLINNEEEYDKKLNSERVPEGIMTIVNANRNSPLGGYPSTPDMTPNKRSRGRRGSQKDNDSMLNNFGVKADERPPSGASNLPVSNCLICGDKATGLNGTLIDISTLLRAEVESKESAESIEPKEISSSGPLTVSDICSAFKVHLFRLINWAKQLECFSSLDMPDQLALLRGNAGELLLLSIVWQAICSSSQQTSDSGTFAGLFQRLNSAFLGVIKAGSGEYPLVPCCVDDNNLDAILKVIANTIYRPLLELAIGEMEFICLKAIIFLCAGHLIMSNNGRITVEASRSRLQMELMNVMNDNQYLPEGRFGELLLLIPTLQKVSGYLVRRIGSAVAAANTLPNNNVEGSGNTIGSVRLDDLLGDILLSGMSTIFYLKCIVCPPTIFDELQMEASNSSEMNSLQVGQNSKYVNELEISTWQNDGYTKNGINIAFHLQPLATNPGYNPQQNGHPQQEHQIQSNNESLHLLEHTFNYQQEAGK
ncbi:unnamed protein product [Rodentolepis nana]|uniref:NR LBD domain-containing protein n=1 Tax=Rodentolepis nana TaxID=102285 RepID=A0A0R3T8E5_RODNA|nr:unnamed protein product [Rodentolepis nana]